MPVKERRTKILLLFFLTKDITFEYISLTQDILDIFDLTLNQKTKGTLSAMLKDGLIEKKDIESGQGGPMYKLTEKGFYRIALEFPSLRFLRDEWDGMWRIISYEIPEKKRHLRDRLRREMKGWGLGPWHRSFWMTPHPVISSLRDLVYGREEEQYIQAFESTHMFGDMDVLIEKVWNKSELEKRYKELFKTWHNALSEDKSKTDKMKEVVYNYVEILRDDPGLPPSIVGRKWISLEAFNIFKEIRGILLG
jgi:phenylacetic acid degradation operon negative regulatory protein